MAACKDWEENVMILFMRVNSRTMSIMDGVDISATKVFIGVTLIWDSGTDKESGSVQVETQRKVIGSMEYSSEEAAKGMYGQDNKINSRI